VTRREFGNGPGDADEFGLPRGWVRDEPLPISYRESDWRVFQDWADARGIRAFPASDIAVLLFLADRPVSGHALVACWQSIDAKHGAHYWHTDANPIVRLELAWGVRIEPDGRVIVDGPRVDR
jgi:hypothetical protein